MSLSDIGHQCKLMAALLVGEVWDVERHISRKLNAIGTKTICSLTNTDIRFIRKHFNVMLKRTMQGSRDEPCPVSEKFMSVRQEVVCSRPSDEKLTGYNTMREAICTYAAHAAEKLRREHQPYRFISTFIKTSLFSLNEPYYGDSASIKLLTPAQGNREIVRAATRSLGTIWQEGRRYQKAGVMLGGFLDSGVTQLNLFNGNAPRHNSDKLVTVLGTLNAEKGKGALYFAGQGIRRLRTMKRDMLSPRYMMRYSDLLRVRQPLLS